MMSRGPSQILRQEPEGKKETQRTNIFRQLFRDAFRALTRRDAGPAPKSRRRRTEDTDQAFRFSAKKVLRRVSRIPLIAPTATLLLDTLDWLNPWECFDLVSTETDETSHYSEQNHLFPHP
jgi:hypothetical protein